MTYAGSMDDRYSKHRAALTAAILARDGVTPAADRQTAYAGTPADPAVAAYVATVRQHAYRVTDDHVAALRAAGARDIRFVCVVAAPEGIAAIERRYPDVPIYTPVVDRELNAQKFIVPGLGDAGDRLFGTV